MCDTDADVPVVGLVALGGVYKRACLQRFLDLPGNDAAHRLVKGIKPFPLKNALYLPGTQEAGVVGIGNIYGYFYALRARLVRFVERGNSHYKIQGKHYIEYDEEYFPYTQHLCFFFIISLLLLYYLRNLWHIIVKVARAEYYQYVEVAASDEVKHVFLAYHALLYTLGEVVVDEF